jgi:pimeloyl-ACP methyl ester carboxylesterase
VPYFREAGAGPGVVCLHANAGHSGQWRALSDMLAATHHVLCADSYGHGRSPAWPANRPLRLRDEVALLEPVFERAADPFVLVAHSYGAAVALMAALAQPRRVRALVLYEPTLFALLDQEKPAPNQADGMRAVLAKMAAALEAGFPARAAGHFIDYWMGPGAWDSTPESRRGGIAASVTNARAWARALFEEPATLAAFRTLDMPVLYMMGRHTPASARGVARLLTGALPRVEVVCFEQLGHMGPVTHPEIVNVTIRGFLEKLAPHERAARPLVYSGAEGNGASGTGSGTRSGAETGMHISAAGMRAGSHASLQGPTLTPPQAHPWPQATAPRASPPASPLASHHAPSSASARVDPHPLAPASRHTSQPTPQHTPHHAPQPAPPVKPQGLPSASPCNDGRAVMNGGREVGPAGPQRPTMQLP